MHFPWSSKQVFEIVNVHTVHSVHTMNTVNTVNVKLRLMSAEHRYILEKGSKKHLCPECTKRRFVRYIDTVTSNYLPYQYGRCDKGDGHYFLNPYLDGYVKTIREQEQGNRSEFPNRSEPQDKAKKLKHPTVPCYFDFETFKQTLEPERYKKNTFIQNLFYRVKFPFEVDEVTKVVQLYRLGTIANGYRAGANTFPFIDIKDNVRAIQVKHFDETNHTTGTDFLHSIIEKHHTRNKMPLPEWLEAYKNNDKKVSCLFGEHLLSKHPSNPVALVEAPKTAIYATLYFGFPEQPKNLIWLAVYNKSSFSFDKLKVLQGRDVFTFPDLSKDGNTFKEWETKAKEFENRLPGTRFIFSDLLERLAPEKDKTEGNDLADYLIIQDWRPFRKRNIIEQPQPETLKNEALITKVFSVDEPLPNVEAFKPERIELPVKEQPENWSNDIAELKTYFANIELPAEPVKLNHYSTVINVSLFIESHQAIVKANNGKRTFLPYLNRLQELKQVLTINSN